MPEADNVCQNGIPVYLFAVMFMKIQAKHAHITFVANVYSS